MFNFQNLIKTKLMLNLLYLTMITIKLTQESFYLNL